MTHSVTTRLSIEEEMTIYQASAQKKQLLSALQNAERLELDLSAVSNIDSAGLQLLILLKREVQTHGKQLAIVAHSAVVQQVLDFCNLAGTFGDPVVIPAGN